MTLKDEKLKLNSVIYEEAADWIVELRESEVDDRMRERLDAWFRTSPEHIRAYLELSSIWEDGADPDLDHAHTTERLIALVRSSTNVIPLTPSKADGGENTIEPTAARVRLQADLRSATSRATPPGAVLSWRGLGWPAWVTAGAAACVAVAVSVYVYSARNVTFTTEVGEQRFEKLIDGSTIELNSKSRVRIRYSARERNVDLLEGQALFRVAKDASRPFIVRSDSTLVRAVGTQFDVYRKPTGTVVTVVEGRVAVLSPWLAMTSQSANAVGVARGSSDLSVPHDRSSAASAAPEPTGATAQIPAGLLPNATAQTGDALFLSAGEQVVMPSRDAPPRPTHADTATVTAWTQHELVFEAAPLTEVAQEFNRYNTRPLTVDDPALAMIHITGIFSSSDPSALIKFLRTQRDLVVLESDRDIRIVKR
jgi:transmembrane sensor